MSLNVEHLLRTAATLEQALPAIERTATDDAVMFDLFRNAAIKSFEWSLETAGKLLRKALKAYGGSPRSVDALVFNDVLRHAGKHGLSPLYMLFWCQQNMEGIKARANGSTFMEISKRAFRPIPALVPSSAVIEAFWLLRRCCSVGWFRTSSKPKPSPPCATPCSPA